MCAKLPILRILGHVIVNWDTKKHKMAIFGLKIYYTIHFITQKPLDVKAEI